MKKLFPFLVLCLLATISFAQDKTVYDANAEKRTVSNFHAIRVSHGIELLLKQGDTEAIAISAKTKEQRDAIKTEVVNGELKIHIEQKLMDWWRQLRRNGVRVKAYVSFKSLDKINGSSGSKTTIDGNLTASDLFIDLSSGASLTGELKTNKLDVDQSSGAKSTIKGTVQDLNVETSSGAQFYGYDLSAAKGKADASSGGKIELSVTKEIDASASSGGGINYKGAATATNLSTSSGGKIKKQG